MKVNTKKIVDNLTILIREISDNDDLRNKISNDCYEKFNIAPGDIMDYFSGRKVPDESNTLMLYILCWGIDKETNHRLVTTYFTETEIRELDQVKIDDYKIKFPILIKCMQVDERQWIGASDAQFFMRLRQSQMINYNTNAQRTMKRVVRGGVEGFRINLNHKSVDEIADDMVHGSFIPNTITLNIPENEYDFRYDPESSTLVINSLKQFDIADGYHRYMGMCKDWDANHDFNQAMELRITHFPDSRTQSFIGQEAKRNPISKVDSASMDMNAPANIVTQRVNEDTNFFFSGEISRNGGIINFGEFAMCVRYFYFKGEYTSKAKLMAKVNVIKNELVTKLNQIFSVGEPKDRYSFEDLLVIFTGITRGYGEKVIYACIQNNELKNPKNIITKSWVERADAMLKKEDES